MWDAQGVIVSSHLIQAECLLLIACDTQLVYERFGVVDDGSCARFAARPEAQSVRVKGRMHSVCTLPTKRVADQRCPLSLTSMSMSEIHHLQQLLTLQAFSICQLQAVEADAHNQHAPSRSALVDAVQTRNHDAKSTEPRRLHHILVTPTFSVRGSSIAAYYDTSDDGALRDRRLPTLSSAHTVCVPASPHSGSLHHTHYRLWAALYASKTFRMMIRSCGHAVYLVAMYITSPASSNG